MLKALTVWNFALLEQIEIDFSEGLNILTGETGAGKSILIDALGAVLGKKVSSDMIRTGCEWLRVEGIFSIENAPELKPYLLEQAIDVEDDSLIITRQVTNKGKSMVLVNGSHVPVAVLKKIGEQLINIHGQNESLVLLKPEKQFELLDNSDSEIPGLKDEYGKIYNTWSELCEQYEKKKSAAVDNEQRRDMLNWQIQEIESAQLRVNEDEELESEIKKLANAEKITENVEQAYALLQGDGNSEGIISDLAIVQQNVESTVRYDAALSEVQAVLKDAMYQLQEAFYSIRDYRENLDFNPVELDKMQSRLSLIDRMKKKYGASIEAIQSYYEKIKTEIAGIENYDNDMEELEQRMQEAKEAVLEKAKVLTSKRKEAAKKLSVLLEKQIKTLGMPEAKFSIALSEAQNLTLNGADSINMYFSANLGEAAKPIDKVASGGELSRIALAIKVVSSNDSDLVGSMVFDEIDTGIGGRTAQMVAEKIAMVAAHKQVLCITHLPQIACMADAHLYIYKTTRSGKTVTQVKRLSEGECVNEIARMASGVDASAASIDNAREMINHAVTIKKMLLGSKKRR